ncbi:toll/interleukin-1 receptor domain-containing adapter protein isoform X2 [Megalops cyprinoides]|uniref:toll/interleukin-1 receptor domain-containing adapter protein isoform X2 n=1 Tax=Megalops cyprinoides TaxID=118141 RepID=UPI00186560DC|nr:toll/interleukin-1 receptor domain-containing adapter protein isoform X2 [Megalops cyprinoides]
MYCNKSSSPNYFHLIDCSSCLIRWLRRLRERRKRDPLNSSSLENRAVSASSTSSHSPPPQPLLSAAARWCRAFDVCVCHSTEDAAVAQLLVSHLEARPHGLRCFLQLRDSAPGGAVPTELCEAVRSSHCWALLITPHFLLDPWCRYQMHQALAEAPMSNRIIPLVLHVSQSEYPAELRFYYYINLTGDPERGYELVYKTVLNYLEDMCRSVSAVESGPDHVDSDGILDSSGQMPPAPEILESLPSGRGDYNSTHAQLITGPEHFPHPELHGLEQSHTKQPAGGTNESLSISMLMDSTV